ncbi:hypothetical protein AB6Q56_02940 [Dechloromonas sp. ARDL1]|uniref:pilus assembly PilX family protein n=1 Tax=Dechloromonas sp. ARDL1 TaxID=3322121 RepID=UPI003DA6D86A
MIALIALIIVSLAGLGLIRSVDTASLVSGNYAFKSSTQSMTDLAVEEARAYLETLVTTASAANTNLPVGCTASISANSLGNCRYYARQQNEDGVTRTPFIDWANGNIPKYSATNPPPSGWPANVTPPTGYEIQFVIERLCNTNAAVAVDQGTAPTYSKSKNTCLNVFRDPNMVSTGSGRIGSSFSSDDLLLTSLVYRATVRVAGPRNTITITQAQFQR